MTTARVIHYFTGERQFVFPDGTRGADFDAWAKKANELGYDAIWAAEWIIHGFASPPTWMKGTAPATRPGENAGTAKGGEIHHLYHTWTWKSIWLLVAGYAAVLGGLGVYVYHLAHCVHVGGRFLLTF